MNQTLAILDLITLAKELGQDPGTIARAVRTLGLKVHEARANKALIQRTLECR